MKKKLGNAFGAILNIIIVIISIVIIIALSYVFQTKVLKKDMPDIFGYSGFEVISGSMSGTIEIGDMIIVRITNKVEVDDIIVYKEGNSFITHRLISKYGDQYITKGDANNSEDKEINSSQVVGKVAHIIPKVSFWKEVFSTPIVIIAILTTVILIGLAFPKKDEGRSDASIELIKNSVKEKNEKEAEKVLEEAVEDVKYVVRVKRYIGKININRDKVKSS